ncbi:MULTISPECIES: glutathione S-transferase family protein [Kordiimonas]|uniref:glutathione S-transferase family protein n=1 Tax=Kordiimonas TaxID=288021 RepID=UPI00257BFB3A|nr:glutathione S-transferase family protein [Kordiimonas sp. UBA4487]
MQLCGHSVSPYFERVVIALDMKGALDQIELAGVPGGFKSETHFSHHPMGKIPFLIKDDGTSLTEGQVIAEYLDRVLDGPDLTPHDFEDATRARLIARILDLYYAEAVKPYGRMAFGGEATDAEVEKAKTQDIPAAFTYLEKYLGDGSRAVGDDWTLADAALISHLYWYGALKVRFGLEGYDAWPKLNAYWETVKDTDIVLRSFDRVKHSYDEFFGGDDS